MGYGGVALTSALTSRHGVPQTMVRRFRKEHGTSQWVDGYLPKRNDRIAIVDDVCTSGGTLYEVYSSLESDAKIRRIKGLEVVGAYVVVLREDPRNFSLPDDVKRVPFSVKYLYWEEDFF
jgi:orotate phosphoribosyltransferase